METPKLVIEIGVILAGSFDAACQRAIKVAMGRAERTLSEWMPRYDWRFTPPIQHEWSTDPPHEVIELLAHARQQRDANGWDSSLILTAGDLVSHYKPFCFAAISSALDAAVMSTARIDPKASDPEASDEKRCQQLADNLYHLTLHCIGHWVGLPHLDDGNNVMRRIGSASDLCSEVTITNSQLEMVRHTLDDIADQRLEEQPEYRSSRQAAFYIRAAWENKGEIRDAVLHARPWQFPIRLSRLTTAAVSAVLLLLMTAETWDMASSQRLPTVILFFLAALIATTAYVTVRQQLLLHRSGRLLTEQIVTSNLAATAIVGVGMLVTYALLLALALVVSWCLFPPDVLDGWAVSIDGPLMPGHYALVAGTVASLGLIIGALGASFEQQRYFRHVVLVDEEV